MATTTKFPKGLSIGGKKGGTTDISGVMGVARGSFDPTSATQIELFTLPKGAIPIMVASYGGATGGSNPTVDIGTTGDDDGMANELDADGAALAAGAGAAVAQGAAVAAGAALASAPGQMAAPTLVVDSDTQITATLAADPADGGSPIASYDLRYSTDEATWTDVIGVTSPHVITGLAASTLYYVQTRAVNAVGAGAWSASATATTDAAASGPVAVWQDDFSTDLSAQYAQPLEANLVWDTTAGVVRATSTGYFWKEEASLNADRYVECEVTAGMTFFELGFRNSRSSSDGVNLQYVATITDWRMFRDGISNFADRDFSVCAPGGPVVAGDRLRFSLTNGLTLMTAEYSSDGGNTWAALHPDFVDMTHLKPASGLTFGYMRIGTNNEITYFEIGNL